MFASSPSTGDTVETGKVTTDAHGIAEPRFDVPDWPDPACELLVSAQTPQGTEALRRSVTLKRTRQVMLSTDKPVYQPGQVIKLRALALRQPDLKPVAGQPAVFTVTDPKGNVIYKQGVTTSAFGIAASFRRDAAKEDEDAACALADELIEGTYTVACKVGLAESKVNVEVQRYVLPKFKVELTTDRPFYAPNEPARVTVQYGKADREAAVHAPQPSEASSGGKTRRLEME